MELHGNWLRIARAIDHGAGTLREVTDALDDGLESRSRVTRAASGGVHVMKLVGLIDLGPDGLLRLTEKARDQLMVTT